MSDAKHTAGPWRIFEHLQTDGLEVSSTDKTRRWRHWCRTIAGATDEMVADVTADCPTSPGYPSVATPEEMLANADRIVACVNACEGINPEAVPGLLEACEALAALDQQTIQECIDHEPRPGGIGSTEIHTFILNAVQYDTLVEAVRAAKAAIGSAIAKARGDETPADES